MDRADTKLAELGTSVREMLAVECAAHREIRAVRAELLQQIVARNASAPKRSGRWRVVLLGGGLAAVALALWTWARLPLTFEVGLHHLKGRPGDLVRATGDAPAPLRFSDGSSLALHEGGRLRVLATDARGARVLVEDGTVDVHVARGHLGKKRWRFEAGPFSVQVTGTRFNLSYRALDQSFGLAAQEGQVIVSGACLRGPTPVSAGSRLALSCLAKPVPARPASEPPAASTKTAGAALAPPSSPPPRGLAWRELLAAGRLREGVRAAELARFDRVCQTATSKELLLLADGARLFDRTARALDALGVLRQRFSSSPEAATAAFALGRIAFEQRHAYADATRWFATYLDEQPNGPLMGDAFGRLMEARFRAGDQTGARSDAEHYLRRFPDGPYASQARGILAL
jgi:transmembrane sensor